MDKRKANSERRQLLRRFENLFDLPMVVLGFVWLALLIIELIHNTSPLLETLGVVIWAIFIVDFAIKFILAPEKPAFLKKNILTIISLAVPAFRVLRAARVLRLLRWSRGARLVKVVGSLNRGMRALSATMKRRAFGYVILLSTLILFGGAAGMYAFENQVEGGLADYGTALWWTAMILTTMGSEYWPQTLEGRLLCILLALYAFAVFGYVTATLATFFIGRDAADQHSDIPGAEQLEGIKKEIRELKKLMESRP